MNGKGLDQLKSGVSNEAADPLRYRVIVECIVDAVGVRSVIGVGRQPQEDICFPIFLSKIKMLVLTPEYG